jgi:hypothetical protein
MLIQFIKENQIYPTAFVLYFIYNLLVKIIYKTIVNDFPSLGDEFFTLPSTTLSYLTNLITTCGIAHFGVYVFYKMKKNEIIK